MQFKIPFLPPSVNHSLVPLWHLRRLIPHKSVVKFKREAPPHIPYMTFKEGSLLKIDIEYHGGFYNKGNKEVKRKDGPNMDKILIDVISQCIGVDDKFIWYWQGKKVHEEVNIYTLVNIEEMGV